MRYRFFSNLKYLRNKNHQTIQPVWPPHLTREQHPPPRAKKRAAER
jgi:hypothetical protein